MTTCTIAIPVYNRETLVRAAVESALAQTADDLEILVIDNASTDGTWDALQTYRDPRLRLVRNDSNIGLFGNLNRCLELARGETIRILCSDDRLVPGCIAREIALMRRNPGVALLSTRGRFISAQGEPYTRGGLLGDLLPAGLYRGDSVAYPALWVLANYGVSVFNYPSGILMRRDAVCKAGLFNGSMKHLGDMDYWFRLLGHGNLAITEEDGCEVMLHDDAITTQRLYDGEVTREYFDIIHSWRAHIGSPSEYRGLLAQCSAYSLYLGYSFWRQKRLATSRAYLRAARQGSLALPAWTAALRRILHRHPPLQASPAFRSLIPPHEDLN